MSTAHNTVRLTHIEDTAVAVGNGAVDSGTMRIAIASDSSMPLPSGGATAAKQDAQTALLTSIAGYVDGLEGMVDGLEGFVDGLEGALAAGISTATKQDTGNASLASIDGKITAVNTGAVTISSALPAGTNAIGKLASNTGVTIGAVEIVAGQTLATVTTVSTVTTCSTVTTVGTLTGSGVAHDAADSGNPHKIGAIATASMLGDTPVAAADRTNLKAGLDGALIVREHTSLEDIISEVKTNTDGASTAMTGAFAATASQRIYLTTLILANSSASAITVDIRDGSGGAVLATIPVPAGGGAVIPFPVPLRFSVNTEAAFDGSAAATTLTVTMIGFKSKQ